jgi:uncharacterized protein
MTLFPIIQKMIGEAMKAHDEVRTSTLRLLSSAFNYERIEKQHELSEDEELVVIRKQAKQRKDSIEAYSQLKNERTEELKKREAEELKILQEFLPPEMDEGELTKIIDEAISTIGAKSMADMGKVIGLVKSKAQGADGGKIAEIVKTKLT